MKKFMSALLAVVMLATLAACGGSPSSSAPTGSEEPKLSGKVVVYSPHGENIMTDVAEWFEAETGVTVEFITGGGGELVDRIRAEKSNPQCDVIYGNPTNVYEQIKGEGLLAKYTPSWADKLDAGFKDSDGYYYGTIQTPVVLFYNHNTVSEADAPKDWSDLADPRFAGQIVMRSTTSAASRATISAIIDQHYSKGTLETEGWAFLEAFDKNVKSYVTDSSLMFSEIAKGEAQLSFWTLDGITTNINTNGMPLTIVPPASGAVVISDCIGMVEGAKNADNAKAFIDFVGSKEVQLKLAENWNRIPTHPEAVAAAPDWMRALDYKAMDVNWGTLTENQSSWMQHYNDEIVDSSKNG